jgi:putative acetyltransferase
VHVGVARDLLGPVGVLPSHQRCGVGQELVREGLKAIKDLGAEGCALVYYSRFGFTHAPELVFEGVPPEYCMILLWVSASLAARWRNTRRSP